jgi:hypothetical protein
MSHQYKILIQSNLPDGNQELPTLLVGEFSGNRQEIATRIHAILKGVTDADIARPDARCKAVRVLWVNTLVSTTSIPIYPAVGTVYSSLSELAYDLGVPKTSLAQYLANFKQDGFSGAVYRGLAYAYVDQAEARPEDLPAVRRDDTRAPSTVTVIKARHLLATESAAGKEAKFLEENLSI